MPAFISKCIHLQVASGADIKLYHHDHGMVKVMVEGLPGPTGQAQGGDTRLELSC